MYLRANNGPISVGDESPVSCGHLWGWPAGQAGHVQCPGRLGLPRPELHSEAPAAAAWAHPAPDSGRVLGGNDVETGFPAPLHRRAGAKQTAPEASRGPGPASPHQCEVTAPMCSTCCASVPVPAGPRERRGRQKTTMRTHTPTPAGKHVRSLTCAQFQSTCPRQ